MSRPKIWENVNERRLIYLRNTFWHKSAPMRNLFLSGNGDCCDIVGEAEIDRFRTLGQGPSGDFPRSAELTMADDCDDTFNRLTIATNIRPINQGFMENPRRPTAKQEKKLAQKPLMKQKSIKS